jgi:hypothetical protein
MKKWLLGLSAVALLAGAAAIAQVPSNIIASPSGLEQIEVLAYNASGPPVTNPLHEQVTINQIRNAEGYLLIPAGTTVSQTAPNTAAIVLATGAITTLNLTFPTAPYDGELLKVGCPGGNISTLNNSATLPTGVTIVGASFGSCTESTPTDAAWVYNSSGNIWYRTE